MVVRSETGICFMVFLLTHATFYIYIYIFFFLGGGELFIGRWGWIET
jgi:hypothetical protein